MSASPSFGTLTVLFAETPRAGLDPILVLAADADGQTLVAMHRYREERTQAVVEFIEEHADAGGRFDHRFRARLPEYAVGLIPGTRRLSLEDTTVRAIAEAAYERLILQAALATVDVYGVPWDASRHIPQMTAMPGGETAATENALEVMHAESRPRGGHAGFYTFLAAASPRTSMGDPILVIVGTNDGATLAVGRRGQEGRGAEFQALVNQTRVLRLTDAPERGSGGPYTREWVRRVADELRGSYRLAPLQSIWVRDGRTEAAVLAHELVDRKPMVITKHAIAQRTID